MNYLAHSFLSCGNEELLIGNLITDLIRKKDEQAYNKGIQKGINLHRKIDSYIDKHPLVLDALHFLYPTQGKYAPVVMDILWDYYLSINWEKYNGDPLSKFTNSVYIILEKNYNVLQEKVKLRFENMIAYDFLNSCNSREALRSTFSHLQKRTKFNANFDKVDSILDMHHEQLNKSFMRMFPEMINFVELNCDC